jgi:hypothetical protein
VIPGDQGSSIDRGRRRQLGGHMVVTSRHARSVAQSGLAPLLVLACTEEVGRMVAYGRVREGFL